MFFIKTFNMIRNKGLFLLFFILNFQMTIPEKSQAQMVSGDSAYKHRNNIKLSLTPWVIYSNVLVFSYERSIAKNRTFSITAGLLKIPTLKEASGSTIQDLGDVSKFGFTVGGDYRFYLNAENKYPAPHGIYIGPYLNYYHFKNQLNKSYQDSLGNTPYAGIESVVQVFNIGVQVGYQFVVSNRFTIDCTLVAPSLARYSANFKLTGAIDSDHAILITEDMINSLKEHFPLLGNLVENKEVHVDGQYSSRNSSWGGGFKYTILIGYRFGK